MYEEPEEQPSEKAQDPKSRAKEKSDEFRMHAELAAVFEGPRKFDAELKDDLVADAARQVQRAMATLEKARVEGTPVLPPQIYADALEILHWPQTHSLSTNDYHLYRRPGELMVTRWLQGEQVETFYGRFQAHVDAALNQYREEERQQHAWKQDEETLKYLASLDEVELKMADRYLRDTIKQHKLFVLSTQAADEIDILYVADYLMSVPVADLVGEASAPPDEPTEADRAWFFKLFSLRGLLADGSEGICFFAFFQKSDEAVW